MTSAIAAIRLIGGWLPIMVDLTAVGLLIGLAVWLVLPAPTARARRRIAVALGIGAVGGAVVGWLLTWFLSDQLNLFEVSLTPVSRSWILGAFAASGVAIVAFAQRGRARAADAPTSDRPAPRRRALRRILASVAAVSALAAGALGVNADFGQYTTVGSLVDTAVAPPFPARVLAEQLAGAPGAASVTSRHSSALWRTAADIAVPGHGLVGAVTIPATVSKFPARGAYVYLPPAALVTHPVALPVLIMMSGQPGSPANVISSGQIAAVFDAFARAHGGLAPIVVAPDQLGAPARNPMCVNGTLGASETYLTVDVPNWIRTHLTVQAAPDAWAIGGFSQGGTCSIQLGSAHPELFSAIVDISGQFAPENGGLAQTTAIGFGGSTAAYRAALPTVVMARHAPYRHTVAVFGVGALDSRYGPFAARMTAAARASGMDATEAVSPGTGHDWHTVHWVFTHAMTPIFQQLGLVSPS
jgi:enterochelin esterase-like enzyme